MEHKETKATLNSLVEAIFELRWKLPQPDLQKPPLVDGNYKLAVGALFTRLHDNYPEHEQLPSSALPDQISAYVVQHRFKTVGAGWPLVQIGQGILTVNDIQGYKWETFQPRVTNAVEVLLDTYASMAGDLQVSTLALRYINAIDFDFQKRNVLSYLKENMGFGVELAANLKTSLDGENPNAMDLSLQFQAAVPEDSNVTMRFFRGQKTNGPSGLMWETSVQARPGTVQSDISGITSWAERAHKLARSLFDALTANVQKEGGD